MLLLFQESFNKNRVVLLAEILFKHKPIAQRSEQCFNKSQTATSSGFIIPEKGRDCKREGFASGEIM